MVVIHDLDHHDAAASLLALGEEAQHAGAPRCIRLLECECWESRRAKGIRAPVPSGRRRTRLRQPCIHTAIFIALFACVDMIRVGTCKDARFICQVIWTLKPVTRTEVLAQRGERLVPTVVDPKPGWPVGGRRLRLALQGWIHGPDSDQRLSLV